MPVWFLPQGRSMFVCKLHRSIRVNRAVPISENQKIESCRLKIEGTMYWYPLPRCAVEGKGCLHIPARNRLSIQRRLDVDHRKPSKSGTKWDRFDLNSSTVIDVFSRSHLWDPKKRRSSFSKAHSRLAAVDVFTRSGRLENHGWSVPGETLHSGLVSTKNILSSQSKSHLTAFKKRCRFSSAR